MGQRRTSVRSAVLVVVAIATTTTVPVIGVPVASARSHTAMQTERDGRDDGSGLDQLVEWHRRAAIDVGETTAPWTDSTRTDGRAAGGRSIRAASFQDPIGDAALGKGDIVSDGVNWHADDRVEATITTVYEDWPTSYNWRNGETGAFWDFDVNGDGVSDFYGGLVVSEHSLVVAAVLDSRTDRFVCGAVLNGSTPAPPSSYSIWFEARCLGRPAHLRWYATLQYEDVQGTGVTSIDYAPDAGWAGPVDEDVFAPSSAPCSPTPLESPYVHDGFATVVAARLLDTRTGYATIDCAFNGVGALAGGSTFELQVGGRAGVPVDAAAVVMNLTAVDAGADGFVTAFPCGTPRPDAASVIAAAGRSVPNFVVVKLGDDGRVCLFTYGPLDLVVDLNGFYTAAAPFVPLSPTRLVDTRPELPSRLMGPTARLQAGSVTAFRLAGVGGVTLDAKAVVLEVTAVDPAARGYLTVYPCDELRPVAANLNYEAASTRANGVIAKLDHAGRVCVFTYAATDLVIDLAGFYGPTSNLVPTSPMRFLDTRPGTSTFDGARVGGGPSTARNYFVLFVNDRLASFGLWNTQAIVLNIAVVDPDGPGFLTAYPCGGDRPNAASLTYAAGETVSNLVIVPTSSWEICIFTYASTHVVVDVNGIVDI